MIARSGIVIAIALALVGGRAEAKPARGWGGASRATDSQQSGSLRAEVLRRARAAMPAGLSVVQVSLPRSWNGDEAYPAGTVISLRWRGAPRPGMVAVELTTRSRKGQVKQGWIRLEVRRLRNVLVAARAMRAGEEVSVGDLVVAQRPTRSRSGWQMEPEGLLGARILADVAAGAIVDSTMIEAPAPIARGTEIQVVVRRGAVVVSAAGRSEHSARPGERTAARVGTRVVSGRLIDGATLLVGVGR